MDRFAKILFALAALVPGTAAHHEASKRKFKAALRDAGYTRSQLRRIARAHFRKD